MALSDTTYANKLKAIHAEMLQAAIDGNPKDDAWYSEQIAKALDEQVKTAEVSTTVTGTAAVTGPSGSFPVTGTGSGSVS